MRKLKVMGMVSAITMAMVMAVLLTDAAMMPHR